MSIAFFDMDKTLLKVSSGTEYVKWLAFRGKVSPRELLATLRVSIHYKRGILDFPAAMARMGQSVRGGSATATTLLSQQFFDTHLVRGVAPIAVIRVRKHQDAGDLVYILTASMQFAAETVAHHLGIPYRCTTLEIVDDKITGNVTGPACFGTGKIYWATAVCAEHGLTLADATFYSDSISDLPLLEKVGKSIVVNPDRKLRKEAQSRGWPIELFY